jgi:rhodanese-related sulfurtransferase
VAAERIEKMNKLDKTLKGMDLEFFASGQHGVTAAMVADCLENSEPCVFLDVRTETEARYLRVGNVQHIPLEQLPDRIAEIPRDRPVIVFCTSVVRASMAAFYLRAEGITSVRTLMANSEEIIRLFSPARLFRRRNSVDRQNHSKSIQEVING